MNTPHDAPAIHRFAHDAMACTFEVAIVHDDARYARQAAEAAFDEIDRLERVLSRFVPNSDIAAIAALAARESLRVEPDTVACLEIADALHRASGGAFDIAFRTTDRGTSPPLALDPSDLTIVAQRDNVVLDLGGIGKGYALDCVAGLLDEWQIPSAIVHAGQSTVLMRGQPSSEGPWTVALRGPHESDAPLATLSLSDVAFSGSGQVLHGRHIVDGRTGKPVPAEHVAWALAPSAALADGLSTALMLVGRSAATTLCGCFDGVTGIFCSDIDQPERMHVFGADSAKIEQQLREVHR